MAGEEVLDVEIDWETCTIRAHLDGSKDPETCKKDIMAMLDGLGDFTEGGWTIGFRDLPPDPNAKQRSSSGTERRAKETN